MATINGIYKEIINRDRIAYIGLLRNKKKFNINDIVFFAYNGGEIAKGRIIGVEIGVGDNPEYKYKIQLSEEVIENRPEITANIICDHIFYDINEARTSALSSLEQKYRQAMENIDDYFGKLEDSYKKD